MIPAHVCDPCTYDPYRQCNSDIEGVLHERKALDKLISTSGLKSKELNHKMNKLNKDATEAKQQVSLGEFR